MSENIRTVNLSDNTIITDRDVLVDVAVRSIDINQTDGTYAVVEPMALDGGFNGRVVIYPQSPVAETSSPIYLQSLNRVGDLYYPTDAKFDPLRRKLWIADTGNDRVLKVNLNSNQVDLTISNIVYPHALAVDLNTGDIFIKAYESSNLNHGAVFYYRKDGVLNSTFLYNRDSLSVSSSSSSFEGSMDSSSSSGIMFPSMPSSKSIVFDHVRSRLWWVDAVWIYMADIRNKQIQTYNIRNSNFAETVNLDIEFSTGNAFVIVIDVHGDRYLIQMNRDNNNVLGTAYVKA